MVELVEYLVKKLVEDVSDVRVEEQDNRITIWMNKPDMGKIIGKQGKIIKAIRIVVKTAAPRGVKYSVDVSENVSENI